MSLDIDLLTRSSDNGTYAKNQSNIIEYINTNKPKPQLAQLVLQQAHSPPIRVIITTANATINIGKSVIAVKFEKMIAF